MKFTLTTYDSMLAHNAGYVHSCKSVDFLSILEKLTNEFAKQSGVKKEDIYWQEVTNSDWCKSMIILWARVPADWKPTKETYVIDEYYDPKCYNNLSTDIGSWIRGQGCGVDHTKQPAQNPHSLYRSSRRSASSKT